LLSVAKRKATEVNNEVFANIEHDQLEFDSESMFSKVIDSSNSDDLLTFTSLVTWIEYNNDVMRCLSLFF